MDPQYTEDITDLRTEHLPAPCWVLYSGSEWEDCHYLPDDLPAAESELADRRREDPDYPGYIERGTSTCCTLRDSTGRYLVAEPDYEAHHYADEAQAWGHVADVRAQREYVERIVAEASVR